MSRESVGVAAWVVGWFLLVVGLAQENALTGITDVVAGLFVLVVSLQPPFAPSFEARA